MRLQGYHPEGKIIPDNKLLNEYLINTGDISRNLSNEDGQGH